MDISENYSDKYDSQYTSLKRSQRTYEFTFILFILSFLALTASKFAFTFAISCKKSDISNNACPFIDESRES